MPPYGWQTYMTGRFRAGEDVDGHLANRQDAAQRDTDESDDHGKGTIQCESDQPHENCPSLITRLNGRKRVKLIDANRRNHSQEELTARVDSHWSAPLPM